jgi:hypothetical protein
MQLVKDYLKSDRMVKRFKSSFSATDLLFVQAPPSHGSFRLSMDIDSLYACAISTVYMIKGYSLERLGVTQKLPRSSMLYPT